MDPAGRGTAFAPHLQFDARSGRRDPCERQSAAPVGPVRAGLNGRAAPRHGLLRCGRPAAVSVLPDAVVLLVRESGARGDRKLFDDHERPAGHPDRHLSAFREWPHRPSRRPARPGLCRPSRRRGAQLLLPCPGRRGFRRGRPRRHHRRLDDAPMGGVGAAGDRERAHRCRGGARAGEHDPDRAGDSRRAAGTRILAAGHRRGTDRLDSGDPAGRPVERAFRLRDHRRLEPRAVYPQQDRGRHRPPDSGKRTCRRARAGDPRLRRHMDRARQRQRGSRDGRRQRPCRRAASQSVLYAAPRLAHRGRAGRLLLRRRQRGPLAALPYRLRTPGFPRIRLADVPGRQREIRHCGGRGGKDARIRSSSCRTITSRCCRA